jgi:hypothetical protein
MTGKPFVVLNRGDRKVIHQAATLAEARGYSEARDEPTAVAMIAETLNATEWAFCFQCVNSETGDVLMQSAPMDFDQAAAEMYGLKLLLVPACLTDRKAVRT